MRPPFHPGLGDVFTIVRPYTNKAMKERIKDYRSAERILHENLSGLDHEEVWCIFLTNDNRVISTEMLSKGTLSCTAIDNRTVIRRALLNNAAGIILSHNHPSGNPNPSVNDVQITEKMRKACDLMDISLIDHIIFTDGRCFSFSEELTFSN